MTKIKAIAAALVLAGVWYGSANAQTSVEDRLQQLEQRIRYLEQRVASQDATIVEKERQITELKGIEEGWFNSVEFTGVVEIELAHEDPYEGDTSSNLEVGTVDVGFAVDFSEEVSGELVLTYDGDDDKMTVDTAAVTLAPPGYPLSFVAGKQGLPFGVYETGLVSDPLTLELGDTGADSLHLVLESNGFAATGFVFKGNDDKVGNFGAALGYSNEGDESSFSVNLSYIDDIGQSDTVGDAIAGASNKEKIPGGTLSLAAAFGDFSVFGEYVTAMEDFRNDVLAFNRRGARPAALALEAAWGFELFGRDASLMAGFQTTSQAQAAGLPESRMLVGMSVDIADGLNLTVEFGTDTDYGSGDGGTGKEARAVTALLAAEF